MNSERVLSIWGAAALLCLSATATAQTPIEPDATIGEGLSREVIEAAVQMVRQNGYRCDSVSSMQKFLLSRGFNLYCNRFNYHFQIEDKGGRWTVTVK
jgi:hypothetical protein